MRNAEWGGDCLKLGGGGSRILAEFAGCRVPGAMSGSGGTDRGDGVYIAAVRLAGRAHGLGAV